MKRIALFCDGTWNAPEAKAPTNVVKLYQAARSAAEVLGPQRQRVFYISGVGTKVSGNSAYLEFHPLRDFLHRYGGGASVGGSMTRSLRPMHG